MDSGRASSSTYVNNDSMTAAAVTPLDHPCQERFRRDVLSHSDAKSWHLAKREWVYLYSIRTPAFGRCVCGKRIKERCHIWNKKTEVELVTGSHCVLHFDSHEMSAGAGAFSRNLAQLEADRRTAWANDTLLRAGLRPLLGE